MNALVHELILNILLIVVTAGAGILVAYIKKRLGVETMKKIEQEVNNKKELARLAVLFAEQYFRYSNGEEKYVQASKWMSERLSEIGLSLSDSEIRGLLESSVHQMNKTLKAEWDKAIDSK